MPQPVAWAIGWNDPKCYPADACPPIYLDEVAVMQIVAKAVDDQVGLRMATAEKQGYQSDTVVWRCPMTEPELRIALQRCRSRVRLALAALEAFRVRFSQLAGPLPIVDAAELINMADGIRDLLGGEEGMPDVRP